MKRRFRRILEAVGIADALVSLPDTVRRLYYVGSGVVIAVSTAYAWFSGLPSWQIPIVLVLAVGACAVSLVLMGTAWDWLSDHIHKEGAKPSRIAVEPLLPPDESDHIALMAALHEGEYVTVVDIRQHLTVTNHADLDTRIQKARMNLLDRRDPSGVETVPPLEPPKITLRNAFNQDHRLHLPARDAINVELEVRALYPAWIRKHNQEEFSIRLAIEAAGEVPATVHLHSDKPAEEASLTWLDLRGEFLTMTESLGGAWIEVQDGPFLDSWHLKTPATAKAKDVRYLNQIVAIAEDKFVREYNLERHFWSGSRWFSAVSEHSSELKLASKNGETDEVLVTRQVVENVVSHSAAFCQQLATRHGTG